jgi:hypothetical protein
MLVATFATLATLATLVACNVVLGIDEQGVRPIEDAGADAVEEPDSAPRPSFEACTRDADCIAPNGCYTPHCDTVLGACTYALCEAKGKACAKGTCDTNTFVCTDPLPYGFLATRYDVSEVTSGCGPKPDACVAAAFPYVLLGTRDNVIALRGDDLTGKTASKLPVSGISSPPQQLVASGRRIWVLGTVQGQSPPYQLSIASIDVPSDPTVAELSAHTTVVSYPFPSVVGFPAPNGGLFVVYNDATQGFPAALVQAPVIERAKLGIANAAGAGPFDGGADPSEGTTTMYRVANAPAGSTIVASSGARLVAYRYPSTFNLVTAAGTAMGVTEGDLGMNPALYAIGAQTFEQGPDGTVMMMAPVSADAPLPDCNCASHARFQYVFPNAVATTTDVSQQLDPEAYVNPQVPAGACRQCAGDYYRPAILATWLDRRTALTAAPFSGGPNARMVTDVRLLGRDPLEANAKRRVQTKPTDTPKGELGVDRIALTSSNGIGYLILADGQGNDVSLSIVDPRCDVVP